MGCIEALEYGPKMLSKHNYSSSSVHNVTEVAIYNIQVCQSGLFRKVKINSSSLESYTKEVPNTD